MPEKILREVVFKAGSWSIEDTSDNECIIHVSGLTPQEKTVYVKIEGFTPYVYLELPNCLKWNKTKINAVFEYFKKSMGELGPIKYKAIKKQKLHYKENVNTVMFSFPNGTACRKFASKCHYYNGHIIPGVGKIDSYNSGSDSCFKVHEHNIDPIMKYTSNLNIPLSGWIKVKEYIPKYVGSNEEFIEDEKFSTADIDLCTNFKNIVGENEFDDVHVNPKYLAFDGEMYSKNHNSKLPDYNIGENKVFQISIICGRINCSKDKRKKYLLSLFNPLSIQGVEVIRCKTEKDLILEFSSIVRKEDPDLFITYNGMKFDWDFLIGRAKILSILPTFLRISRIKREQAQVITPNWSSSAYGEQKFSFPDCRGRVNVDALLEVERNYKLPKYSLNYVAEKFLGRKKVDITPRQLFILYQITNEMLSQVETKKPTPSELNQMKKRIKEIFPYRLTHGDVRKYRKKLLSSTVDDIVDNIREAITLVGIYCNEDSNLTVDLVEKLNLTTTMEQMSNVMHVPTSYLHTRGQQIKVLAQVYREAISNGNNYIIPYKAFGSKNKDDEDFQGAVVIEAHPGDYNNVGCLDFKSLYPTVIIAFNICYTTILEDNDPTPDSECHVLTWEEHTRCSHDPQKRKKKNKNDKVLCGKYKYRFRKVIIKYDENTGEIIRINEGLMPKLERNLLTSRSNVKKEMFKIEARLKMQRGEATDDDIKYYKKCNFEIIKPHSLGPKEQEMLEISEKVLNAKQLAIKISANSAYGSMGARQGFIPFIPGAASVTAMGRKLIMMTIDKIRKTWENCRLVYGDTDSCMILFENANVEESFKMCEEVSKIATHHLKSWILGFDEEKKVITEEGKEYKLNEIKVNSKEFHNLSYNDKVLVANYESIPIDLEFENMYGRFLLLTKKRYVAFIINKDGKVIHVVKKGVVLVRRNNCDYLRVVYKDLSDSILENKSEEEVMIKLYDHIQRLFTLKVPDPNLIIYTSVKSVMSYASKTEKKNKNGDLIGIYHIDEDKKIIEDPVGPLDPRLVYPNLPQCTLARKMLRRGTDVPPNTRLEYLYIENPNAIHEGDRLEDYIYYKEHKGNKEILPDYIHYLEKQLAKPITELLSVKYPRENIIYENKDDALKRLMYNNDLSELKKSRIAKTNKYSKVAPYYEDCEHIGWDVFKNLNSRYEDWEEWVNKNNPIKKNIQEKNYNYKGNDSKIQFIIESSKLGGVNDFNANKQDQEGELVKLCKDLKARNILNKIYSKHGISKRPSKKPTQVGEILRVESKVILTENVEKQKKGTYAKIIDIHKEGEGKNIKAYYDLLFEEDKIINNVSRKSLSTFYNRDGKFMEDICKYRKSYKEVVEHIKILFKTELYFVE